jgi:hypothetical protein
LNTKMVNTSSSAVMVGLQANTRAENSTLSTLQQLFW